MFASEDKKNGRGREGFKTMWNDEGMEHCFEVFRFMLLRPHDPLEVVTTSRLERGANVLLGVAESSCGRNPLGTMSDGASQRSCGGRRGILKVKEPCRNDERRCVTTKLWWPSRNLEGEGTPWGRGSQLRKEPLGDAVAICCVCGCVCACVRSHP